MLTELQQLRVECTKRIRSLVGFRLNFSLASQSVDLLIGTMLTVPDNTHPWMARYEAITAGRDFSNAPVLRGAAFKRPGYHLSSYQFSVNNVTIPNFRIDMNDAWQHAQIAMGLSNELIQRHQS